MTYWYGLFRVVLSVAFRTKCFGAVDDVTGSFAFFFSVCGSRSGRG